MNDRLREIVGKAVYSALDLDENERLGWDKTSEKVREQSRKCGEAAVRSYIADTDQALTFEELTDALDRISTPTQVEDVPLSVDPDDYPVV